MRSIFLQLILLCCFAAQGQADSTQPPYLRYPTVPPFKILLADSLNFYSKDQLAQGKPLLLMVFNPDCSHCQHETEQLREKKDAFKDFQIVMITLQPLWEMNAFVEKYKVAEIPNVVTGKDVYYFSPSFFRYRNLPFHALYNARGELITTFEGSVGIEKILDRLVKGK